MASSTELFEAWKEGFANKDSNKLAELLTDDFRYVSPTRNLSRQEALDWTDNGGFHTLIDNLEVLYENDEVAVLYHCANRPNVVMALYTKRGDKFSHCRTVRQEV